MEYHAYWDILDGTEPGTYSCFVTAQIGDQESGSSNTEGVEYTGSSVPYVQNPLIPKDNVLYQNYPNPFNPVTTFWYGLPETNRITFKVYNMLGQEVATLTEKVKPAEYHALTWNAASLSSGLYYVPMESGRISRMQIILLLK